MLNWDNLCIGVPTSHLSDRGLMPFLSIVIVKTLPMVYLKLYLDAAVPAQGAHAAVLGVTDPQVGGAEAAGALRVTLQSVGGH